MDFEIRPEREEDCQAAENLTREAFWNVYRPGCAEHYVLHELRGSADFIPQLDFVAQRADGSLVGSIVYSMGTLTADDGESVRLPGFGPVGVLPEYQRRGVGSALIEYSLERAKRMGFKAVLITGSPEYYRRFGFESCSDYGVFHNGFPRSEESPFFMIKLLDAGYCPPAPSVFCEPDCFFPDERSVEAFDAAFPEKQKEVREGQL